MQKCGPSPKAMCGLGKRSIRNESASAKTVSSRLAEPKKSASASPARICWPPTSVSCRAVRMKWRSGEVQQFRLLAQPYELLGTGEKRMQSPRKCKGDSVVPSSQHKIKIGDHLVMGDVLSFDFRSSNQACQILART